jgi:uncharacterized protein (DUF302 family)
MTGADIYRTESTKPLPEFIADLSAKARENGFLIHNAERMDMARTFGEHGVGVADDFDLHMVQLCKPAKAGESLGLNPERAPLMPKFIMVFSREGKTQIRLLRYHPELVAALVDDPGFADSLADSFAAITGVIEAAA